MHAPAYRMASAHDLSFEPFRLDWIRGDLRTVAGPVALTPKALAVLDYLAERPDRLVTKTELLDAVWPGVFVADGVLKVCVREIRRALGDDARVAHVRITTGDTAPGVDDDDNRDIVMMDDFLYGEPRQLQ